MNNNVLRLLAGLSVVASSLVATPAQAALQGTLQRGQTQYLEVTLEPGKYLFYVVTTDTVTKAASEASLSIYETNGRLLKKSAVLPSPLHIRPRPGVIYNKGTGIEVRRRQTVHFWVQMDACEMLCGFGIIPVKVDSNRLNSVDLPATVLPEKPSYNSAVSNRPQPNEQNSNPTNQTSDDRQKIYIFQTNSFTDTGVSVNAGDRLKIQATGLVRFGFMAGSGGPRGIAFNPEYNVFLHMAHGQLMARIRRPGMRDLEGWMAIGEGGEFVAESQGVLEFGVNDSKSDDNTGNFRIEVTIDPAR
ncbi:hypothetical protein H6G20_05535 [Desertifilum sp. FACHB-1129]|uniref:hypothetical protein n=1 Tax=unclassified Desertifilum TaxID=2621682 RepID=UPI001683194D|nr:MULTISPECIES: hypothetical protein [unclassified Desertifilum]MBD2311141.1 hypothetical protein [Desertifilum sp. FACHB-1129]MBD2324008.1 hypothetical protein [Desertifilum sp. FACHB-866]MBD2333943.1 hypothetical protein [Desertifilum sp. FACHB-868]MDA0211255.1 hypothetical protein [Cyanobacteria bacterium FC1]